MLDWIFASGSGLLSTSIGLNAMSSHGTCTAVFVAVAAIISFGLASIRTLGKIKWTAWVGLGCIVVAGKYSDIQTDTVLTFGSIYGYNSSRGPKQATDSTTRRCLGV